MFERLRKRFKRYEIKPMPIRFTMDRTADNKHRVQIYRSIEGVEQPVANPDD